MKTKLSFSLFIIAFIGYSQTPISSLNSASLSEYALVTASTPIDQTAVGANLTWTFNALSTTGTTTSDTYGTPTTTELATYPGTTSVFTVTESPSGNTSTVFSKDIASEVSITGGEASSSLILNYTDNAVIGTFPLSYGYSNTDAVAGTVSYTGGISEPFTGTATTDVDAYGTLEMNDVGSGIFNGNVTRLKTEQNITFPVLFLFSGTVTLISYNYYADNGDLVFRTTDTTVSIPISGINDNTFSMESLLTSVLSIDKQDAIAVNFKIAPNPVKEILNIRLKNNQTIRSIQVTNMIGKEVLKETGNNTSLQVSHLQTGVYFVTVTTEKGVLSQKFVKL